MIQNLKVDIIYYKTNTDFEMEFNLCGCCRMRLLTDKASDKKTLVHDLARAVSRSRVIIIAGELSGEEGIIETTAKSIAKTVTAIDKSMYGIKSEESIGVIAGATPLVSPEGEFGGCIIESGPQSMILLSDDRELRKAVMKTLIHPYIEELCALDIKAKAKNTDTEVPTVIAPPEPITDDETEEIVEAADAVFEETSEETEEREDNNTAETAEETGEAVEPETKKETELEESVSATEAETETEEPADKPLSDFSSNEDDVTLEGGMIFETDDSDISEPSKAEGPGLFIEPQKPKKIRIGHQGDNYALGKDGDSAYRTPDDSAEEHKSLILGNLPILIISVLLLIVLAVLCYCIFYVPAQDGVTASAYLHETFKTLFG